MYKEKERGKKMRTVFKIFGVMWNRFYPIWHIGVPPDEDSDACFEICLGYLQICIWKREVM